MMTALKIASKMFPFINIHFRMILIIKETIQSSFRERFLESTLHNNKEVKIFLVIVIIHVTFQ
jgi:hypothetical protein